MFLKFVEQPEILEEKAN